MVETTTQVKEKSKFLEPVKSPSTLRFTPYAWAKLLWMRDRGNTEIGGYGITDTSDPMLVADFVLIKQKCTSFSVELDEKDSAIFVEEMLDDGIAPWQCQNVWIHTHPGNCAEPSMTDETNFKKNFSHPNWAIFFILAKGGDKYCRMVFNVGPCGDIVIKSEVDWCVEFETANHDDWEAEYKRCVTELVCTKPTDNLYNPDFNLSRNSTSLEHAFSKLYSDCPTDAARLVLPSNSDIDKHVDGIDMSDGFQHVDEKTQEELLEIEDSIFESHGCAWYWDEEDDSFIIYDPVTDEFRDDETGQVFDHDDDKPWMNTIKVWAKINIGQPQL